MKKIALLLSVLMLVSIVPFATSAAPTWIKENPPVEMPKANPVIDGVINWDEGWSAPAKFNLETVGFTWQFLPLTTNMDLFFAYSDEGLYFAADITEHSFVRTVNQNGEMTDYEGNGFTISNGLDIEGSSAENPSESIPEGESMFGWNGDVLCLLLDPEKICYKNRQNYCPWYDIGVFESDGGHIARIYRARGNYGEVTDRCDSAVTVKTSEGYTAYDYAGKEVSANRTGAVIEVFIPWDIVAEDVYELNYLPDEEVTPESLAKDGANIQAAAMYIDRSFDKDKEDVVIWGRFTTVCEICEDGLYGYSASAGYTKANGIKLVNTGKEFTKNNPFTDVKNTWYTDGVLYCFAKGYMNGTAATTFAPTATLTRSMFVTILANIAKADLSAYDNSIDDLPFTDVKSTWYTKALKWALENGYTGGTGANTFSPDMAVTREQLAVFLSNFAKPNGLGEDGKADITTYPDYSKVSGWARDGLSWAVYNKLLSGKGAGSQVLLAPKDSSTRAEVSLVIKNFVDNCLSEYNQYRVFAPFLIGQ